MVANAASGECASQASACVEARTTGTCTAPPLFAGIADASDAGTAQCGVHVAWSAAQPACGAGATYSVYRSPLANFVPDASNRIATDVAALDYTDSGVAGGAPQYYLVRSTDPTNAAEDGNLVRLGATPTGPAVDGTFASGAEPGDPLFDAESAGPAPQSDHEVQHAGWHYSTSREHSGTQSFWSTAANNLCVTLVTPTLALTSAQTSTLSFWSAWDVETGWDGGVIEISTDSGTTWTRLTPLGGYPGAITDGGTLCGIAEGDGAFTGENQLAWTPASIDLSAYAGMSVRLRWLYRTDSGTTGEGWFVDDIALTHAQVPGVCSIDGEAIFANGFDPIAAALRRLGL